MAKKDLGNIEEQNKNFSGVNALFTPSIKNKTAKEKKDLSGEEEKEIIYPLRMTPSKLKSLKQRALDQGISIKELIMTAIYDQYSL
jgi:hypothetical protein